MVRDAEFVGGEAERVARGADRDPASGKALP
jgi:hypothetical protein